MEIWSARKQPGAGNTRPRFSTVTSVVLAVALTACTGTPPTPVANTLPPPIVLTATVPVATATPASLSTPELARDAWLAALAARDVERLSELVSADSRGPDAAAFQAELQRLLNDTLMLTSVEARPGAVTRDGASAQATVDVTYATALVGDLTTTLTLPLQDEGGVWRVVYTPAVIWPDLVNGQTLLLYTEPPVRGPILDRFGTPMVENTGAYAVGFVPGELGEDNPSVGGVARLFGLSPELLNYRLSLQVPEQYYMVGEAPAGLVENRFGFLFDQPGVQLFYYEGRYYHGQGAAAHVTGYTTFIQPDQLALYREQGYSGAERIGSSGLEAWGESYLGGQRGGQLQLRDANNQFLRMIAQTPIVDGQTMTTTIDFDLQQAVQFALGDLTAAAVVLDLNNGQVLALASSPTFSPNLFDPGNRNNDQAAAVFSDPGQPQINHATQSSYPAGSVFKIVTMAAGMISGIYGADSRYTCTGTWNELDNFPRPDWLEGGHGDITLVQALSGSCNPWFWHIGLNVHNQDPNLLPQTARDFGLGAPTGIGQLEESPGLIPDPEWKQQTRGEAWSAFDAVNMSIGQGDVLVTPLQIARLVAAVGNGGTLYQPQLVLTVAGADGLPSFTFEPVAQGTLPLTAEQLEAIQTGMANVTREPIGTARDTFRNFRIPIAGKTGTAEDAGPTGTNQPDAWFGSYSYANRPDLPDIAVAVVVQNAGQGSERAAPIARRIYEAYFGLPYVRYWWEQSVGLPADAIPPTPTPAP